jgi:hypothetical protein
LHNRISSQIGKAFDTAMNRIRQIDTLFHLPVTIPQLCRMNQTKSDRKRRVIRPVIGLSIQVGMIEKPRLPVVLRHMQSGTDTHAMKTALGVTYPQRHHTSQFLQKKKKKKKKRSI